MAKNGVPGDNHREGFISHRTQFYNPNTGLWQKRDTETGRIMDVKTTGGRFKDVRRER